MHRKSLKKFIYLSIAAAITTIGLKFIAYYYTGSVGMLSDAIESVVNLLATGFALAMIILAETPADPNHDYGHTKAEYFSSVIEGLLIIIASVAIIWSAIQRMITPVPIENIGIGMLASILASIVNLGVGLILIKNGKKHHSLLLEADGKHLLTDVYTTVGILIAIILIKITGLIILDPIIAIIVALNISYTGYKLIKRSANGLMDEALPAEDIEKINNYLDSLKVDDVEYHSMLTRQAGQRKFVTFHLLVPGDWSVQKGHDLADEIECTIEDMFTEIMTVTTHLEPIEDPASHNDIGIDRIRD